MGDGQLSFFSAGTRAPGPDDLEGVLCGPGQVVRQGDTARVSIVVRDGWRVPVLLAALDEAGISGETADAHEDGGTAVRTDFDRRLRHIADRWSGGGGGKRAPADLVLDGPRLRWWALAAGWRHAQGYVLGLGPQDEPVWQPVGAALVRAGLAAALLGPRADGPAYRVSGLRRMARLAELVGPAPDGVPATAWPG